MTTVNNLKTDSVHAVPLTKRMIQGAAIGAVVVALFLFAVDNANPAWGKFWMIRPILVLPMVAAGGGMFYYFMDHLKAAGGWKKALAYVISLVGFVVALWMGTILGFAGTLWN